MAHIELRNEVQDVTRATMASGKSLSKAAIWHMFKDRDGIGRATVHRWIDAVIEEAAVKEVLDRREGEPPVAPDGKQDSVPKPGKPKSVPKPGSPGGVPVHPAAAVKALVDAAGPDVILPDIKGGDRVAFEALLAVCIRECEGLLTLAKGADGKIRNARLANAAVDQLRRTLATASNIYTALQSQRKANRADFNDKFLDELLAIVMAEMPATRDKVLARFEALRLQYAQYDKADGR